MGRTPKLPPLPPEPGQAVVVSPMPPRVTKETLEDRKRELTLLARAELDSRFDVTISKIFSMPDTFTDVKGSTTLEPLKLKLDALKWLANRGYGKEAQVIKIGADEGTPDAILADIARKRAQAEIDRIEAERLRTEAITTEVEGEKE